PMRCDPHALPMRCDARCAATHGCAAVQPWQTALPAASARRGGLGPTSRTRPMSAPPKPTEPCWRSLVGMTSCRLPSRGPEKADGFIAFEEIEEEPQCCAAGGG